MINVIGGGYKKEGGRRRVEGGGWKGGRTGKPA